LKPLHGESPVLALRPSLTGLHNDPGGKVANPYGRVGNIPVLTSRSGPSIKLHLNV
jgi:hypothetical protein